MKSRKVLVVCFLAIVSSGCNEKSPPRGSATSTTDKNAPSSNDAFVVVTPASAIAIEPGASQEVNLAISRGGTFDKEVTLTFKPPEGVKVTANQPVLKKNQSEAKVRIDAAPDAPKGAAQIEVIGTPETGPVVMVKLPVEIK